METRVLKGLDKPVSLLGFGCMRFPTKLDGSINESLAEEMLMKAYNSGVNYFDTAYPYHDKQSEIFVGKVLDKIDRSSYFLTTKLPVWEVNSKEDAEEMFFNQLKRLNKEYLDNYLLHAMDESRFTKMKDLGVIDLVFELKKKGYIRNVGFSFHDSYDVFEKWIKAYPWDVCQIQFNYMDVENQAGVKGLKLAEELGIPVVVMEPVRGGSLAMIPDDLMDELKAFDKDASKASWALRFVASYDIVKVILSGMTEMSQVEDNLSTFQNYKRLSQEEMESINHLREALNSRVYNMCTGCRYCMPCPGGVNIPRSFHIWNEFGKYGNVGQAKWEWSATPDEEKPSNCLQCGMCEGVCPQKLSIRDDLIKVNELFESLR